MSAQNLDQDQLLVRLRQGESRVVRAWFKHYAPILTEYVSHKVDDPQDVEEIVQQTFINCLHHLPVFAGKSSIKTWMIGIARHEIADYYRKQYAKKAVQLIPLHEVIIGQPTGDASLVVQKVRYVLSHMRSDYRELLYLKYIDGQQIKKMAQELGLSFKSVEADLFRARQDFKELYAVLVVEKKS